MCLLLVIYIRGKDWGSSMKIRKLILLMLITLITVSLTGCSTYSRGEMEIIDLIKGFYATQYEAYSNFEYFDIESYLDMDKIQNQNKVIALKKLIIEHKHMDDMKYCYIDKGINPIDYDINEVKINGDYASIDVILDLKEGKYYPEFVSEGENKFVLKRTGDDWKIVNHSYDGLIYFEKSDRELMPDIDEERVKRIVDNEYGRSPLLP